jgi:hypothetical protein
VPSETFYLKYCMKTNFYGVFSLAMVCITPNYMPAERRSTTVKYLPPSIGFSSIEEEIDTIDCTLSGFSHEYHVDLISLPLFFCDKNDTETLLLKEKYSSMREKVSAVYSSQDFLAVILNEFLNSEKK